MLRPRRVRARFLVSVRSPPRRALPFGRLSLLAPPRSTWARLSAESERTAGPAIMTPQPRTLRGALRASYATWAPAEPQIPFWLWMKELCMVQWIVYITDCTRRVRAPLRALVMSVRRRAERPWAPPLAIRAG